MSPRAQCGDFRLPLDFSTRPRERQEKSVSLCLTASVLNSSREPGMDGAGDAPQALATPAGEWSE